MRPAAISLGLAALVAGLRAGWLWYQIAREQRVDDLADATIKGLHEADARNGMAARWTAMSFVFSASSAIVGAFS
jgi:hypothetical protein